MEPITFFEINKIIRLFITVTYICLFSSCINQDYNFKYVYGDIECNWQISSVTQEEVCAGNMYVKMANIHFSYEIKNNSNNDMFLYDSGRGWWFQVTNVGQYDDTIKIKNYIDINSDLMINSKWKSTGPFSITKPNLIKLPPKTIVKGKISQHIFLNNKDIYLLFKNNKICIYYYNFIIFDKNISNISNEKELQEILEKHIHSYTICNYWRQAAEDVLGIQLDE